MGMVFEAIHDGGFNWPSIEFVMLGKESSDKTHGKMGKHRETHRKMEVYPLVNVYIAMERSTIFNGEIHYFYGHFQ